MLDKIRTLNLERLDLDEAVELATAGRAATTTYESFKLPVPAWLKNGLQLLEEDLKRRQRDALLARQRELLAKQSALKSREEQKSDIEAELASINDALGTN